MTHTINTKHCHHSLQTPPALPWPSCVRPKTLSFTKSIATNTDAQSEAQDGMKLSYFECNSSDPCSSNSFALNSECSSNAEETTVEGDTVEAIIRGLRSDRLLYEPPGSTSSIIDESSSKNSASDDCSGVPFEDSIAITVDTEDPYRDFRVSMEEMVITHGVKNWDWLEEMLAWYLNANIKSSHPVIVGAFLDLLMSIASASSSSLSSSSFCSSCTTFEVEEDEEIVDHHQPSK